MTDDAALLRRYAEERSEPAFAEFVQRHLGLVYGAALRRCGGDEHRAAEVAQRVFTSVARRATALARHDALTGWLYAATRNAALNLLRAERRRRAREREAQTMTELVTASTPAVDWDRLRPVLDAAMDELNDRDREAVLLRFFEGRAFAEVGTKLRLTENPPRMRTDRALAKLRARLAKRGITSTSAALALALANQAGVAAPAGLAASVTGAAVAGAGATTTGIAIFMGMTKLQLGIAGALAVAGAAGFGLQADTNAGLRREIAALREQQQAVAPLRAENQRLATVAAEVEMLRRDDLELKRLAQSVSESRKASEENARIARLGEATRNVQAEIARMNREGNALVGEYRTLVERSKDLALPAEDRAQAEVAAKQKLEAIWMKQREVNAFKESARAAGLYVPPAGRTPQQQPATSPSVNLSSPGQVSVGAALEYPSVPGQIRSANPPQPPAAGASGSPR
jgi:RNA polymerase sigma factor (sigma-70 family)